MREPCVGRVFEGRLERKVHFWERDGVDGNDVQELGKGCEAVACDSAFIPDHEAPESELTEEQEDGPPGDKEDVGTAAGVHGKIAGFFCVCVCVF